MHHNHLPPSPFQPGTTYDSYSRQLHRHDRPPRIARIITGAGRAALYDVSVKGSNPLETAETERKKRLEKLFRLPTLTELQAQKSDISDIDPGVRIRITEQSEQDARAMYANAEPRIKDMINNYAISEQWDQSDIPALLRSEQELRMQVGEFFLDKFPAMHGLPERVRANADLKRPNMPGYGYDTFSNQEVAAMYALAMLDGTFKHDRLDTNVPEKYTAHNAIGQHVAAARMVIAQR